MLMIIFFLALMGFGISLYTYQLEQKLKKEPEYKASCDINDRISCTKPIKSAYGTMFYFSNALLGMLYYGAIAVCAFFNASELILLAAVGACLVSVFLAYILYFRIHSLCILCTSLYIINILLLLFSLHIL